jgi:hypothetical protein
MVRGYSVRVNPRGIVSAEDHERIRAARQARDAAEQAFHRIVVDVTTRSSVRETAKSAGVSPDTIVRWKRDN